MLRSRIALALLLTLPLACGGGGGGGSSPIGTRNSNASGSKTAASQGGGTQVVVVQPGGATANGGPGSTVATPGGDTPGVSDTVTPSSMTVDLEGHRVFLPNEGWLTEEEFWRIYYEEPQRLPGELDFGALHKLGYPSAPPSAGGNPG